VKYYVTVGGEPVEVELADGRVVVGGEAVEARLEAVAETPLLRLQVADAAWTLAAERIAGTDGAGAGRWAFTIGGERVEVVVADQRARAAAALGGVVAAPAGEVTVAAPMPGLVVRVLVPEGEHVEAGAGLVVLEAMKMENALRAPRAGMVARVHVREGQAVEKGAALVTLAGGEL
jgi:biotin carboxyl carrier protein